MAKQLLGMLLKWGAFLALIYCATYRAPVTIPEQPPNRSYDWETHKYYRPSELESIKDYRAATRPEWIKLTPIEKKRHQRERGFTQQEIEDLIDDELSRRID